MTDAFSSPSEASSGIKITDFKGRLLLVTPTEYVENITTSFGDKDAVRADIAVLDGPDAGSTHDSILIFQGTIIGQTKNRIGKGMVLGRLGQKAASKPGYNPAWILEDPTDEDKTVARAHLAGISPV